MRRALMAVGGVICMAVMATTAIGAPVETTDTDDDAAAALDVDKVSHDHDDTNITYTLTTEDTDPYAVTGSAPATIEWALDFDDATPLDACVKADVDTAATLTAQLLDGPCDTGAAVTGTVTVARTTNVFTVTVPRTLLEDNIVEADGATDYVYRVTTTSTPTGVGAALVDSVPDAAADTIAHSLVAAASPTPDATASPTATPADDDTTTTDEDDDTTTASDDDSSSGEVLSSTTSSGGGTESGTLPATGDVADTSTKQWPVMAGFLAVIAGLGLGSVLAYRFVIGPARREW